MSKKEFPQMDFLAQVVIPSLLPFVQNQKWKQMKQVLRKVLANESGCLEVYLWALVRRGRGDVPSVFQTETEAGVCMSAVKE